MKLTDETALKLITLLKEKGYDSQVIINNLIEELHNIKKSPLIS